MKIECPFCEKKQTQKPIKTWSYGKMIERKTSSGTTLGASITCSRFQCRCGKKFNHYLTSKNKSWTIPKIKKKSSVIPDT